MPKFQKGNKAHQGKKGVGGRPKGSVVSLADEAATLVLEQDIATLKSKSKTKEARVDAHLARERISRMCKGRIPTRVSIGGDENASPVPFQYVEVVDAPKRKD